MKFGGENFKNEKVKSDPTEKPTNPSRRGFLKTLFALGVGAAITESPLGALAYEKNEKPPMVKRDVWDDHWNEIKKEYSVSVGETYNVVLKGIHYKKTADVLPYFSESFINGPSNLLDQNHKFEDLKNVYRRCAIHHTDASTQGISTYKQAQDVRDGEMAPPKNFNDVGYHFLIAADGTIMEGRPAGRVGSNAGETKESKAYKAKYLPGGVSDISKVIGNKTKYYDKLKRYIKTMKMDPDYGTLGIVLCGDFDTGNTPSQAQQNSLIKILNWAKSEYDIPTNNIIYHKQVKKEVIEASGLTFDGGKDHHTHTVCPGSTFPDISTFKSHLKPDTAHAKTKTILLDKYV